MDTRHKIGLLLIVLSLGLAFGKGCDLTVGQAAPFKADHLSVLIVEETQDRAKLPVWVNATAAGSVRDTVAKRGGQLYLVDKDQGDFSKLPPWVSAAFAVPHPELPWLVAAGPATGTSQKLPAAAADTLKALEGVK